eukprot:c33136_g1_i1.p1 GENE.c33136_g1_i1~~c33136_g1_i1.p1  ORF type:complete len:427 (-),score=69.09 c33136_g1_i1:26-1306(-)
MSKTGRVERFLRSKGFGFIKPISSGESQEDVSEIFFHKSAITEKVIRTGHTVLFDVGTHNEKPVALNISKVPGSEDPPKRKPRTAQNKPGTKTAPEATKQTEKPKKARQPRPKVTQEQPDVVVVGSANTDLVVYSKTLPTVGETIHGNSFVTANGGKGANQALQSSLLGSKTSLIAKVGRDSFGRNMVSKLRQRGLDTSRVRLAPAGVPTGIAQISVDEQGNNTIIVVQGANGTLGEEDVARYAEVIQRSRVLVCQLEVNVATTLAALRTAKQIQDNKPVTVLNPAPAAKDLPSEIYSLADVLVPNETEAELLSGQPVKDLESAKAASHVLRSKGCRSVVITLGAQGAWLSSGEIDCHVSAPAVDRVVDTSGAGDSFVGALAHSLSQGKALEEAVKFAVRVASISVQKRGIQESYPDAAALTDIAQ